jgi:hypothetical protein
LIYKRCQRTSLRWVSRQQRQGSGIYACPGSTGALEGQLVGGLRLDQCGLIAQQPPRFCLAGHQTQRFLVVRAAVLQSPQDAACRLEGTRAQQRARQQLAMGSRPAFWGNALQLVYRTDRVALGQRHPRTGQVTVGRVGWSLGSGHRWVKGAWQAQPAD